MYRLIFAALTLSAIAIILVVTAGPSQTAEARFIRWDCSDWQPRPAVADADNELASSILETLAANRGKTLYCGLDQSDTWTKRQVYDHAHMHNDRDRTQYDGSQGQGRFRGFTAGQEGWLTDGEHGITGVSPERIFEFPEVKKKRRRYRIVTTIRVCGTANDGSRACVNPRGPNAIDEDNTNNPPNYDASGPIGVPQLLQSTDPARPDMTAIPRCRNGSRVGDIRFYAEPFSATNAYLWLEATCRERRRR